MTDLLTGEVVTRETLPLGRCFIVAHSREAALEVFPDCPPREEGYLSVWTPEPRLDVLATAAGLFPSQTQARQAGFVGPAHQGLELYAAGGLSVWIWCLLPTTSTFPRKRLETERYRAFKQAWLAHGRGPASPWTPKCGHGVSFDPEAARGLPSDEVRRRWPRFAGRCERCGYEGIDYASMAHMVAGDW